MDFGTRLKELREKRQWDRADLGKKLGVSYSTIAKYETNARFPDQNTLIEISRLFSVSVDYLLGRTNIPHSPAEKFLPQTIAAHHVDGWDELPEEAKEDIMEFVEFVKQKYAKREGREQNK